MQATGRRIVDVLTVCSINLDPTSVYHVLTTSTPHFSCRLATRWIFTEAVGLPSSRHCLRTPEKAPSAPTNSFAETSVPAPSLLALSKKTDTRSSDSLYLQSCTDCFTHSRQYQTGTPNPSLPLFLSSLPPFLSFPFSLSLFSFRLSRGASIATG
jgi:hypothetical protein